MRTVGMNMKPILCLLALFVMTPAFAVDVVEVITAEGVVTVGDAQGKTSRQVVSKSIFPSGQVLTTGADARAVVKVGSDGYVVVGKNSKLEINKSENEKPGFFKQLSGIVYYAINSITNKQRPVEVRTATTTIGIRGTRFLVSDTEERNEIGMRKGVINVASVDGDFEVRKKSELDEFEAYKQQAAAAITQNAREFEDYKAKTQQEFVEFKKEFSLSANRMATFDGKRVVDVPLSGETQHNMESIESFADEWLKKVND